MQSLCIFLIILVQICSAPDPANEDSPLCAFGNWVPGQCFPGRSPSGLDMLSPGLSPGLHRLKRHEVPEFLSLEQENWQLDAQDNSFPVYLMKSQEEGSPVTLGAICSSVSSDSSSILEGSDGLIDPTPIRRQRLRSASAPTSSSERGRPSTRPSSCAKCRKKGRGDKSVGANHSQNLQVTHFVDPTICTVHNQPHDVGLVSENEGLHRERIAYNSFETLHPEDLMKRRTASLDRVFLRMCSNESCEKTAYYFERTEYGRVYYCIRHRTARSEDIYHRRCEHPMGCNTIASYGLEGGPARFCASHKKDYHVLARKSCVVSGCRGLPCFKSPESISMTHCKQHRLKGQIKASHLCRAIGCNKTATFGDISTGTREYCAEHRLPQHRDVQNKICNFDGCTKRASYGSKLDRIPSRCAKHADRATMEDVRHVKCKSLGCSLSPSFGSIGDGLPIYCSHHRTNTTVNVRHFTCQQPGCAARPWWSNPVELSNGRRQLLCRPHRVAFEMHRQDGSLLA